MSTPSLPTVRRTRRKSRIAFSTDLLVAVVFGSEDLKRGFNNAAAEAKDEVKRGFFLDIVIA